MIAGVDIGLSGAIAFLTDDGKLIESFDMPTMKVGDKNEIDEDRIVELFSRPGLKHVFFEKAQTMPAEKVIGPPCPVCHRPKTVKTQGIASTGHYMASFGLVRGICKGVGVPYSLIHPATWKKIMMRDMPKEKSASTARVQQLFPGCGFNRVKDHHKADAVLIGLYGLKEFWAT